MILRLVLSRRWVLNNYSRLFLVGHGQAYAAKIFAKLWEDHGNIENNLKMLEKNWSYLIGGNAGEKESKTWNVL